MAGSFDHLRSQTSSSQIVAEISLETVGESAILPVIAHGREWRLAFDTGTIGIILHPSEEVRRSVSGLRRASIIGNGVGGHGWLALQTPGEIAGERLDIQLTAVPTSESDLVLSAWGEPADGRIAASVFKNLILEVNRTDRKTRVWRRKGFEAFSSFKRVPIRIIRDRVFIEASINSDQHPVLKPRLLSLQTTLSSALILDAERFGVSLLPGPRPKILVECSRGVIDTAVVQRMKSLTLGSFVLKGVPAGFSGETLFQDSQRQAPATEGFLGGAVLSRFDWILDFSGRVLYLRPNDQFGRPFLYNTTGITLDVRRHDGSFRISDIMAGSPADEAGIAAGDLLEAINDQSTKSMGRKHAQRLIEKTIEPIQLTLRRNEDLKTVTLERRDSLP